MLVLRIICYSGGLGSISITMSLSHNINAIKLSGKARKFMSMIMDREIKLIFQRQQYFNELAEDGDVFQLTSRCASTSMERPRRKKPQSDEIASTLAILLDL